MSKLKLVVIALAFFLQYQAPLVAQVEIQIYWEDLLPENQQPTNDYLDQLSDQHQNNTTSPSNPEPPSTTIQPEKVPHAPPSKHDNDPDPSSPTTASAGQNGGKENSTSQSAIETVELNKEYVEIQTTNDSLNTTLEQSRPNDEASTAKEKQVWQTYIGISNDGSLVQNTVTTKHGTLLANAWDADVPNIPNGKEFLQQTNLALPPLFNLTPMNMLPPMTIGGDARASVLEYQVSMLTYELEQLHQLAEAVDVDWLSETIDQLGDRYEQHIGNLISAIDGKSTTTALQHDISLVGGGFKLVEAAHRQVATTLAEHLATLIDLERMLQNNDPNKMLGTALLVNGIQAINEGNYFLGTTQLLQGDQLVGALRNDSPTGELGSGFISDTLFDTAVTFGTGAIAGALRGVGNNIVTSFTKQATSTITKDALASVQQVAQTIGSATTAELLSISKGRPLNNVFRALIRRQVTYEELRASPLLIDLYSNAQLSDTAIDGFRRAIANGGESFVRETLARYPGHAGRIGATIKNAKSFRFLSANELNAPYIAIGKTPPYLPNSQVINLIVGKPTIKYRVFFEDSVPTALSTETATKLKGRWLFDFDPSNFSDQQMQAILEISNKPNRWGKVMLMHDIELNGGIINRIKNINLGYNKTSLEEAIQWEIVTNDTTDSIESLIQKGKIIFIKSGTF